MRTAVVRVGVDPEGVLTPEQLSAGMAVLGRLAAEVRAAVADYAETNYLLAEQRRLVAAAIASQYIEYRRTQTQLDLLEQSTDLQDQTLRIVTLRFEAGLAANLDVRRAAAGGPRSDAISASGARRGTPLGLGLGITV